MMNRENKGNEMKKIVLAILVAAFCLAAVAHRGPVPRPLMHGPRIHHAPPPPSHHRHHSHGAFWTGVGVGLIGSLLAPPPPPVVIQAAPQRVWIPPVYGERPVYRAGIYVGTECYVITPGYWATSY